MCLAFESYGETTLLDLVPQPLPGKDDVFENFDFDSFLHNTKDVPNFDFDVFLQNDGKDNLDTIGNSVPTTTPNVSRCFQRPQPKMIPIEMENLQQSCTVLGQNYLRKIVTIHNACKKVVGLEYPDVLQNQLLTTSRTLTKLADLIVEHHTTIVETGVMGALEGLVFECQYACDRFDPEHSLADSSFSSGDNAAVVSLHKTYIKDSELIAYDCLVPLAKALRAFTCKSAEEQKDRLRKIATKYLQDIVTMDDSKTDVDDKRSILSGNTLLGVQEAKEKCLKVDAWEVDEDDDVEPTGCFFRMFFRRNSQKKTEATPKHPLKSKLASARSKIVPKKIKAVVAARQHKKDCKLYDALLSQCTNGTVEELTKALTRNRKAVECIQQRPFQFLHATVTRSPVFLKCLIANCMPLDLNAADEKGRTPLYHAAYYGKEDIISILTTAGANKEVADKDGMRPLHIGARKGQASSIAALVKAGAKIEAPGPEMNKPLHYAVEHNTRCKLAIDALLIAGADINATNLKLSTPLHAAIRFNRPSAQQHLVFKGADIEALRIRWETPVKYAVSHGKFEMLHNLLTAGANPDAPTCENKTALHSAAANKGHGLVQLLLNAGCKVDPKGKNGSTPLYMAAQNGRIRNAQLLVAAGADLNAQRKGKTPLETAKKYKNLKVVEVLEKASLGLPYEVDKIVEDHANDHTCSWEEWFERYVIATMEWRGIDSGVRGFALERQ